MVTRGMGRKNVREREAYRVTKIFIKVVGRNMMCSQDYALIPFKLIATSEVT